MGAEQERVDTFGQLEHGLRDASPWYHWGPYLSERQWGTVREDYSPGGNAWEYLPHDHARSRAYRWGEDGLAGFSDVEQRLCVALALWNGRDPILKERIFGLTGNEGNHGEDAKEYWWYVDATPSHAWNRWRYHYPQRAFPYGDLVAENARRGKLDPEYELLDTGSFDDDRYWIVEVDYAKGDPHDLLMTIRVTNAGPETETLHVLPTLWYRNTWAWEVDPPERPDLRRGSGDRLVTAHPFLGPLEIVGGGAPRLLFCDNETNADRLYGSASASATPKDGINDHVVDGADTVAQDSGTKAAFWYTLTVEPGAVETVRVRLRPLGAASDPWTDFDRVTATRRAEADDFYMEKTPPDASADEAAVLRQALAGMLWTKQLYIFDVARWLDGDPTQPPPPDERRIGRNARWRTFDSFDILSMPDTWEYPWFAAWDLAFHCVALARVDPAFAKYQLILLSREWFQHPSGALPAYEWSFDDVNPPVQGWAALEVFAIDGGDDIAFLNRIFDKLLVNFTWWMNREDPEGDNVFGGGFLGLDNIGPLDRSHLPAGWRLEQADGTGWMAFYALSMIAIATILNSRGRSANDLVLKFLEHFALISAAFESRGLWDEEDGFFYDQLHLPDGRVAPVDVRSIVGILPLLGAATIEKDAVDHAVAVSRRAARILEACPARGHDGDERVLLGVVSVDRIVRILSRLFDEQEFLSPYGLRALSRVHLEQPFTLEVDGTSATIGYEPAESTTGMFGGNSNWRGPVWMPVNFLVVEALRRYARFFRDELTFEYPTGSGRELPLKEIADDLSDRLIALFTRGADGRRPCFGWFDKLQNDPAWRDHVQFHEYFHGDNGAGIGASHQTGWTGLIADLILRSRGVPFPTIGQIISNADVRTPV
jgi:mannosylglycerate hydrolase MGH1-like protein